MTARGSSPTHGQDAEAILWSVYEGRTHVNEALRLLGSLRREAAAQALEDAAKEMLDSHLRGDADWVDAARWLSNAAFRVREGR